MKIKTKYLIGIIFTVILTSFLFGWVYGHKKGVKASEPILSALKGELSRTVIELNNAKLYVTSVEQEIKTLKEAKKAGDLTNKELKALNLKQVNEISRLTFKIDTLLEDVPHTGRVDTIYIDKKQESVIILPFSFVKEDKWLTLRGTFDKKGILNLRPSLSFSGDLWVGIDKTTGKNVAKFTTDCKYVNTVTFNSIKLDLPKVKKYNVSIFVGYGVSKTGLTPLFGVGLGRSLLRF
jgi:hypothetical protein